jgi:hypothetical protein
VKLDRVVTLAAAVAAPILGLCVDQHWLSPIAATDLGAIVATFVAAYHLPNDAARAAQQDSGGIQPL